ncbi:hypothetical protein Tco_0359047 [Tanacetum coccineum]
MSKYDMSTTFSDLTQDSLGTLVKIYHIPLDLRPRLPDPDHFIDHLPNDAIGIYTRFLRFFEVHRRAIPDYLTLRSTQSYVSNDFPIDGYDQNDVTHLCARLVMLRDFGLALPPFGLTKSVIRFLEGKIIIQVVMSIYDFTTLPSWGDAKVVEEPHGFTNSILQCVQNHTTAPATEGAHIPQPTPEEVVASQPNPKLSKNSKALTKRKVSTSLVGPFEAAQPKRKRRLKSKASEAGFSALAAEQADDADDANLSENDYCACTYLEDTLEKEEENPSNTGHSDLGHTGTSNAASVPSFGHADVYQGTAPVGVAGKGRVEVIL